ncbi:Protein kinase domain [Macleaya cordata]|uniref:Protein kinase domain n=1 Tax=Macleaya cordata TaxID=56857 RepID=A0A200QAQ8_MACCD|nr:Protein kinase domain [Macleaya cordata]
MEHISEKKFPVNSNDYKLYEEVGEGVSATVYRALCIPFNEIVAIKVLDLEKCNNDLDGVRREVQTMILLDHPNVLRAHCSFTAGRSLWVVMPYMAGGSCLHIMKSAYPEGFEEPVIATLLREVLKALVYLHAHGFIHRDVKAGNILIDFNGAVKLADFGVSACMFDTGDRQRSRNTFVGTPCWMAPEVMQQLHGYDFKADIWSFGITALELAHGHAPFSKYPPMKVLLMTLQNAPPGLDYERDKRFSKSFKEMVAACLVKDPKKRPTSEKLLKHHFFKHARPNEYLARAILDGLSPLGDRFRMLKEKEADFLVQNKAMYGDKEHLSQQEYIRGISGWNFNLEDLKNQAALIQDYDGFPSTEEPVSSRQNDDCDDVGITSDRLSPESVNHLNATCTQEDELNELHNLENSLASFPIRPLQALKGCFDIHEDDATASSSKCKDTVKSESEQQFPLQLSHRTADKEPTVHVGDNLERSSSLPKYLISVERKNFSGSLVPESVLSPTKKINGNGDRDYLLPKYQFERNYSGTLLYRQRKDANNHASASVHAMEDTSSEAIVQHKGRFKVTSSDLSPKGAPTTCLVNPFCGGSTTHTPPTGTASSTLQTLQYILHQNTVQREQIIKLIKLAGQTSEFGDAGISDPSQISPASAREKELLAQVVYLQQSIGNLYEELQRVKMQNAQLERQLNILLSKDEERIQKENENQE